MTSTPPELPRVSHAKTKFHQAATASVIAPLVAVAVNALLAGSRSSIAEDSVELAAMYSFIPGVIILVGVLLGVFSLFGIRRYGRKGILVKGVVGIVLPLLLAALAIPTVLRAKEFAANQRMVGLNEELRRFASEVNLLTPSKVDDFTTLDEVRVEESGSLVYIHRIQGVVLSEEDKSQFLDDAEGVLKHRYENDPSLEPFRERNVRIAWRYVDSSGRLIGEVDNLKER